jgi:plastocyanin
MKNIVIVLVVVAVLALGGWYYMSMNPNPDTTTGDMTSTGEMTQGDTPATGDQTGAVPAEGTVKEFTVDGKNFAFSPALVTVKKGDTVRIKFVNSQGFHDFVIDEFKVATPQIKEGEAVVEFVADKAGSFEYYCSVGSHRAMGMKGTLTVTE